jgi:hypothetical protein
MIPVDNRKNAVAAIRTISVSGGSESSRGKSEQIDVSSDETHANEGPRSGRHLSGMLRSIKSTIAKKNRFNSSSFLSDK